MKKEEEERERSKNEVPLTLPEDHPVRKLFQKFKQQKELRNQEASAQHDLEKNKQHLHTHGFQQRHHDQLQRTHTPIQIPQSTLKAVQNGTASMGSCSSVVTISQITPIQNFSKSSDPHKQNNCDVMELKSAGDQTPSNARLKLSNTAQATMSGTGRSWMRLRNTMTSPGSPNREKKEGLNNVIKAASMERLSPEVKVQIEEVVDIGESGKSSLSKTDSWDSGLTQSDQRLDHVEEVQSPVPSGSCCEVDELPRHLYYNHEHLFQTTLHEARQELRGEIQALGTRMAVLEEQVGQILRLLSEKVDPLDQTLTPKFDRSKSKDFYTPGSPDSMKNEALI